MIRLPGPLSEQTELLVGQIVDSAVAVHRALGPGFLEAIYRNSLCVELQSRGISFDCERSVTVRYRDQLVGRHRLDLVVNGEVVVERP